MIGVISLLLGCLASFVAFFSYCSHYNREKNQPAVSGSFHLGAFCYQMSVVFAVAAAGSLLYAILSDQFQYKYIGSYSSASLPLFYKIAVFWAGQEGSFLLWLLLHCLIGARLQKRMPAPGFIAYIAVQVLLQILLLIKTPFLLQAGPVAQGMGLNPLLQDFWMVIHPPVVFAGYALFAVPFAYAVGALLQEKHAGWIGQALPWALAAWSFLGAGIFIGAYWAYKTLGWGGYWGWDPVENASLIPWLTGGALVHILLLAKRRAGAQRFAYLCAIYTFVLVLYGTYLTRSGVLSDFSVHSFGRDSSAGTLSLLIFGLALAATLVLAIRWNGIFAGKIYDSFCSREFFIAAGATTLVGLAALILLGTSTPLLSQLLGQPQSIGSDFYNKCTSPLTAVLLLLAALACWQPWGAAELRRDRRSSVFVIAALHGLVIAYKQSLTDPLALLVLCFSMGLLFLSLAGLRQKKAAAAALAHAGLALLCIGVLLSSLAAGKTTLQLSPGQTAAAFGREIRYDGSEISGQPAEKRQWFTLAADGRQIAALTKYTPDGREAAHEPAIYRLLPGDLYLAPAPQAAPPKQQLRLARDMPQELDGRRYTLRSLEMDKGDPGTLRFTARVLVSADGRESEYALEMVHDSGSFRADPVAAEGSTLALQALNKDQQEISLAIAREPAGGDRLDLEVSFKPMIGLVWIGCALITLGSLAAWRQRAFRPK